MSRAASRLVARQLDTVGDRRIQRALMGMLEKVNHVYAMQPVKCSLASCATIGADVPAWSFGRTYNEPAHVCFDPDKLGPIDSDEDWVAWLGMNWHELAHVKFSPNLNVAAGAVAREFLAATQSAMQAFCILEDQRIESMMVALYGSMKDYYRVTFAKYCLDLKDHPERAWLLCHGRKFLDPALLQALHDAFEEPRPGFQREAADCIDRFRELDLSTRAGLTTGASIIYQFDKLLKELEQAWGEPPPAPAHSEVNGGCETSVSQANQDSQAASQKVQQGAGDRSGEASQAGNTSASDDGDDEDESQSEQQGQGDGEDQEEEQEGSGAKGGNKSAPADGAETPGLEPGQGIGHGHGTAPEPPSQDIQSLARQELASATGSTEVTSEIANYRRHVRSAPLNMQVQPHGGWATYDEPVDALVRSIATQMDRIRADADPGWNRNQPTGRLNIQRAMGGVDIDSAFDQWDQGNTDATDIEMVMLLDDSGSMRGTIRMLNVCAWVLKRATDRAGIRNTVMAYHSSGMERLIYGPEERALPNKFPALTAPGNDTEPLVALTEAHQILWSSQRSKKVLFTLTDGAWWQPTECNEMVQAINAIPGTVTHLIHYNSSPQFREENIDWHGHHGRTLARRIEDLVPAVKATVTALMRKR